MFRLTSYIRMLVVIFLVRTALLGLDILGLVFYSYVLGYRYSPVVMDGGMYWLERIINTCRTIALICIIAGFASLMRITYKPEFI